MERYLLCSVHTLNSHPLLLRAKRVFSFSDIILLKSIKTHLYGTKEKLILTNFFTLTKKQESQLAGKQVRDTWIIFKQQHSTYTYHTSLKSSTHVQCESLGIQIVQGTLLNYVQSKTSTLTILKSQLAQTLGGSRVRKKGVQPIHTV